MATQMELTERVGSLATVKPRLEEIRSTELRHPASGNLGEPPARDVLYLDRYNIYFGNVRPGLVRIRLTVRNRGTLTSRPTALAIQAAPFGAFLPWQPLTEVTVPVLAPGASIDVTTEVRQPRVRPIGSFDKVPPRRLLTALLNPDEGPARTLPQLLSSLFGGRQPNRLAP